MIIRQASPTADAVGLTRTEVEERRAAGLTNAVDAGPSRTVAEIVRDNVLTRFNLLLGALFVVVVLVAPPQDAVFGLVLVLNTAVGIVQELRAKRTLDRLSLLTVPTATVIRDGRPEQIDVGEVVLDDLIEVGPGQQVIVDGVVLEAADLEIDEALLTGESEPVRRRPGDPCLSGSVVIAGRGRYRATRVGRDAYAASLSEQARRFALTRSELRAGVDRLLKVISWLLVLTIPPLVWTQLRATPGLKAALAGAVAGSVAMVPEGLVLLTSMAFAVSVIRLGRRAVLVQELGAVEGLARVDTVCFDKTGTLTAGRLQIESIHVLGGHEAVEPALGALGASEPYPNATLQAVVDAYPDPGWTCNRRVPFSSGRRWSGATFEQQGTYVLAAPEVLIREGAPGWTVVERALDAGARVLVLAWTQVALDTVGPTPVPPRSLDVVAVLAITDELRPEAADTLAYFRQQGVTAKIISGDHPTTVAAIAARAGLAPATGAVDGDTLPDEPNALADVLESHDVFGRVDPQRKRAMIRALRDRGHVVAMVGDGVNDVLALKDANLGIAMGSGSDATRAVAQVVLLDGSFAAVPGIVAEGRRVIANIERVANLFVTKTVYAFLLVVAVGVAGAVFPFLPRHLTLVGSVTIGIPAFFLALEQESRPYRPGFLRRVLLFALPTGAVAASATFGIYWLAQVEGATMAESRTIATCVLGTIGLYALALISRDRTTLRSRVLGAMVVLFVAALALPPTRTFFALTFPRPVLVLSAVGVVALTGLAMFGALVASGWIKGQLTASPPRR